MEKIICGMLLIGCGMGFYIAAAGRLPDLRKSRIAISVLKVWAARLSNMVLEKSEFVQGKYEKLQEKNRKILDSEIFDSGITLKNLAMVQTKSQFSADYIYERLMENSKRLRPTYAEMLSLYRSGKDVEAFRLIGDRVRTRSARNFSIILSKLEKISPSELVEQMEVFQSMIQQEKITTAMKKAQRNSVITTVIASCAVFAMIINFAAVVVFMSTISMLDGFLIK